MISSVHVDTIITEPFIGWSRKIGNRLTAVMGDNLVVILHQNE